MINNTDLTLYHKTIDSTTRLEKWTRYNYDKIWWFSSNNANVNKGYDNSNNVEIRIPFKNADINNFSIGDILVKGHLTQDITSQQDLSNTYNITTIKDNSFGSVPHIHITGK